MSYYRVHGTPGYAVRSGGSLIARPAQRSQGDSMSDRTYKVFITFIGALCSYVVIKRFLFADSLTLRNALVQGFFVGFGLAVVTIEIVARMKLVRINGWVAAFGCGLPSNGMFTRAAHTRLFPGPINGPREAMYWRTRVDRAGHTLSGKHDYLMH